MASRSFRSPLLIENFWCRLGAILGLLLGTSQIAYCLDGAFTETGDMNEARVCCAATLMPNGKVMVTGGYGGASDLDSTEIYDPTLGTFQEGPRLAQSRTNHTATTLTNGQVLVVGGQSGGNTLPGAELYDPATGSWTKTGSLHIARSYHSATLLSDGKVLVTGGIRVASPPVFAQAAPDGSALDVAELYDPSTGQWTVTGSMHTARYTHTATLLANGDVLVTGGMGLSKWANDRRDDQSRYDRSFEFSRPPAFVDALANAEIYNHATGTWTETAPLLTPRFNHTATLLPDGDVLIVTGQSNGNILKSAELFHVSSGSWTATDSLREATNGHTATLMKDGRVFVIGGCVNSGAIKDTEFYDSSTRTWTPGPPLNTLHALHATVLLADGKMLVLGGCDALGLPIAAVNTAEIYDPTARYRSPPIMARTPPPIYTPSPVVFAPPAPAVAHTLALPPPPTLANSLTVVTTCIVIITACVVVVVLVGVWLAFTKVGRGRSK